MAWQWSLGAAFDRRSLVAVRRARGRSHAPQSGVPKETTQARHQRGYVWNRAGLNVALRCFLTWIRCFRSCRRLVFVGKDAATFSVLYTFYNTVEPPNSTTLQGAVDPQHSLPNEDSDSTAVIFGRDAFQTYLHRNLICAIVLPMFPEISPYRFPGQGLFAVGLTANE